MSTHNTAQSFGQFGSWVFIYELSGCELESCCCHLGMRTWLFTKLIYELTQAFFKVCSGWGLNVSLKLHSLRKELGCFLIKILNTVILNR